MTDALTLQEMIDRGDPAWRELAALMLGVANKYTVFEALMAFARHGAPSDIPLILPLLDRDDPEVYGKALHAINQIDAPLSVRLYLDMLKTPRAAVMACRYEFFKGEFDGYEDALFDGLKPLLLEKPSKGFIIFELLKIYRPERLPEALTVAVESPWEHHAEIAIKELESQPDHVAIPLFEKLAYGKGKHFRDGLAGLWRRIGPPRDAVMIREALAGDDRALAAAALREIRRRRGAGFSVEEVLPFARWEGVRKVIALWTIAMFEDRRALVEIILGTIGPQPSVLKRGAEKILDESPSEFPVVRLIQRDGSSGWRHLRERIVDFMAWGEREGEKLLGVPVMVTHLNHGVGRTYRPKNKKGAVLAVNFRMMIDGTPGGDDLARGVLLHEIGHHLADFSAPGERAASGAARKEGLRDWYNILIDERMERQLRARRAEWGRYLDRLTSFMFLHRSCDVRLSAYAELHALTMMQTLEALRAGALPGEWISHPAGPEHSLVRIRQADLLRMPGVLAPYQVFTVCLRTGIRPPESADPRVAQALDLIPSGLKSCTHWDVVDLCRKLAALLGGHDDIRRQMQEALQRIQDLLPELTGLAEQLNAELEDAGMSDGVGLPDDLEKELKSIIKKSESPYHAPNTPTTINLGPDISFDRLSVTSGPAYKAAAYHAVASKVRRHAGPLRRHLLHLSNRAAEEYASRRGTRVDLAQARTVVLRPSLNLLVHHHQVQDANLYLGVVIDRSGSMEGDNLDRAKAFAALLAESAKDLPGIEGSIDAFDDKKFIRLGGFKRCAVTGLEADGGNNDAGALYEAARWALRSGKQRKLLIMISDGEPSDCTFQALKTLVEQLAQRHGILCAQVAVEALKKIAFPHYVDLSTCEFDEAVRRFGRLLIDLTAGWR